MNAPHRPLHSRRRFLSLGVGGLAVASTPAWASRYDGGIKALDLAHTHTGERIDVVFANGQQYLEPALFRLNHFLRDHYTQQVGVMDPGLFDQLHQIRRLLGVSLPFEIISGYRDPHTNERLRTTRGGGVAKRSLHTEGRAVDVRLTGVPLAELRDAAWSLQAGGVGYSPAEQFVPIDPGRVRRW